MTTYRSSVLPILFLVLGVGAAVTANWYARGDHQEVGVGPVLDYPELVSLGEQERGQIATAKVRFVN